MVDELSDKDCRFEGAALRARTTDVGTKSYWHPSREASIRALSTLNHVWGEGKTVGATPYDLSHSEICVGCKVSRTTAAISVVRWSRSISFLSLAEKSAKVCTASYLLR